MKRAASPFLFEILAAIWQNFSSQNAKRADGKELKYYGEWNFKPKQGNDPYALVRSQDGQCGAWVGLLSVVIAQQGLMSDATFGALAPKPVLIMPFNFTERMLVKSWAFPAIGRGDKDGYPFTNFMGDKMEVQGMHPDDLQMMPRWGLVNGVWKYTWLNGANGIPLIDVKDDETGVKGQNVPNPPSAFGEHVVFRIGLGNNPDYYDPSYGKIYKGLDGFRTDALDGFYKVWKDIKVNPKDANPQPRTMTIRKVDAAKPVAQDLKEVAVR